ncbi:MAG: histidine triad nucleotide-binding protein [Acidobacteria bacterium]|nr:MAG: histidine triad nucleotide-binding protein [Acidobacteriota bacterium]MCE7960336.1 histidine triad nucleotide-binding protein [Acidobacteria bacterium ACB2]
MTAADTSSCVFCRIVRKEVPARIVHEDDLVVAFHDVAPKSPTHILVIPRQHLPGLSHSRTGDEPLLGHLYVTAARLAREMDIASYRTVTNDGADAGQSVFHLHVHLMAGRRFGWPPG